MTCTPAPDDGRYYCFAEDQDADLIGGQSKIKTRYGPLCDEPNGTAASFQVAYVNVSYTAEETKWAQTGWGKERDAGQKVVKTYRYAEVNGDQYFMSYDHAAAPADDTEHTYTCQLDESNGNWIFSFDGIGWAQNIDSFWGNHVGDVVQWPGEILNLEDPMPGTTTNRCSFKACQKLKTTGWVNANITEADTSDAARWGAEVVSATEIRIWTI